MIARLRTEYPLAVVCRVLGAPRSSTYACASGGRDGDQVASAEQTLRTHITHHADRWDVADLWLSARDGPTPA